MKKQFSLSQSNQIFYYAFAALFLLHFIFFRPKTPYSIGYFVGQITVPLLISCLIAWVAWVISGKRKKPGSVTFNIMLALFLLGHLGQITDNAQRSQDVSQEFENLNDQKEAFKRDFAKTDDPAEMDAAYQQYADSMKGGFDRLSEKSTGRDKQFFAIMSRFVEEMQTTAQKWRDAFEAVQAPSILDYSLLTSDEEYARQQGVIQHYLDETAAYNRYYAGLVSRMKSQLSVLGENHPDVKAAVAGASAKYQSQRLVFEPLIQAHLNYGGTMLEVLALLRGNPQGWGFENQEFVIFDEQMLEKYNALVDRLLEGETTINTLSGKLVEGL